MANYDAAMFVGHGTSEVDGSYDPGATSNGKQEHIIAEQITDKAVKLCRDKGLNIHRDEQNFKDNDLAGNTYNSKYAIEVHLNAGGGKRAELFTPCKDKYLNPEFYMLAELAKLGLANGGVKSRDYNSEKTFTRTNGVPLNYTDYYGSINRAYKQGVSLDILEIGFIDSTDINIIENNIDKIATIIANGVLMVCGKTLYTISDNSQVPVKSGWVKDSTGWWYQYADGSYPKNQWILLDNYWYRFDKNGYAVHSGWKYIDGKYYYINSDCKMETNKWIATDNNYYYVDCQGIMQTGWIKIDNKTYYLDGSGAMLKNTTKDGHKIGSDGAVIF